MSCAGTTLVASQPVLHAKSVTKLNEFVIITAAVVVVAFVLSVSNERSPACKSPEHTYYQHACGAGRMQWTKRGRQI